VTGVLAGVSARLEGDGATTFACYPLLPADISQDLNARARRTSDGRLFAYPAELRFFSPEATQVARVLNADSSRQTGGVFAVGVMLASAGADLSRGLWRTKTRVEHLTLASIVAGLSSFASSIR
jgi:hypothetical protein